MLLHFWVTFTDGSRGTISSENEEAARQELTNLFPTRIATAVRKLPYPAWPVLKGTRESGMPAFCWKPDECAGIGKSGCPQRRACND